MSAERSSLQLHSYFTLHHIGIVVDDIGKHRDFYINFLGYVERTLVIHDPLQTAYVQFLTIPGADHYLELVAPDSTESKLWKASHERRPLHHLGYLVENIEAACDRLVREGGGRLIQDPLAANAFAKAPIAWVMMLPDRLLLELIERSELCTMD